ncbi:hypothetical protein XAB3213_270020 [Xanthomonas citri pv. bilvae]|nr:hypothetical protein XAB3213_270020 [Xanthomonas citri pv. bilvae]
MGAHRPQTHCDVHTAMYGAGCDVIPAAINYRATRYSEMECCHVARSNRYGSSCGLSDADINAWIACMP